jgi:hypothetical protein
MKSRSYRSLGPLFILFVSAAYIEAASTIRFTAAEHTVPEWAGTASLLVQRLEDINRPVVVDYETADETAVAGAKYTATSGTLVFATEETNKTVVVQIFNNGYQSLVCSLACSVTGSITQSEDIAQRFGSG